MTERILVTVSRTYDDPPQMRKVLAAAWTWAPGAVLVHGAQRDSDLKAVRIWADLGGEDEPHRAVWRPGGAFRKFAGMARNEEMARLGAGLCLAFIGPCDQEDCRRRGKHGSHGATHCSGYADRVCGIMTRRFFWPKDAPWIPLTIPRTTTAPRPGARLAGTRSSASPSSSTSGSALATPSSMSGGPG